MGSDPNAASRIGMSRVKELLCKYPSAKILVVGIIPGHEKSVFDAPSRRRCIFWPDGYHNPFRRDELRDMVAGILWIKEPGRTDPTDVAMEIYELTCNGVYPYIKFEPRENVYSTVPLLKMWDAAGVVAKGVRTVVATAPGGDLKSSVVPQEYLLPDDETEQEEPEEVHPDSSAEEPVPVSSPQVEAAVEPRPKAQDKAQTEPTPFQILGVVGSGAKNIKPGGGKTVETAANSEGGKPSSAMNYVRQNAEFGSEVVQKDEVMRLLNKAPKEGGEPIYTKKQIEVAYSALKNHPEQRTLARQSPRTTGNGKATSPPASPPKEGNGVDSSPAPPVSAPTANSTESLSSRIRRLAEELVEVADGVEALENNQVPLWKVGELEEELSRLRGVEQRYDQFMAVANSSPKQ